MSNGCKVFVQCVGPTWPYWLYGQVPASGKFP